MVDVCREPTPSGIQHPLVVVLQNDGRSSSVHHTEGDTARERFTTRTSPHSTDGTLGHPTVAEEHMMAPEQRLVRSCALVSSGWCALLLRPEGASLMLPRVWRAALASTGRSFEVDEPVSEGLIGHGADRGGDREDPGGTA